MKTANLLLFSVGLLLSCSLFAQLPKTDNADYSTKKGMYTDPRDGKSYAYKKMAGYDWFIQNLAYEGTVINTSKNETYQGIFLPSDPTGELYGMLYPSSTNNTAAMMSQFCPQGWKAATLADYKALYDAIIEQYSITDVTLTGNNYTGLAKYLRAGGVNGVHTGGLWATGTIIDPKAAQIGFNALPSGVYNINKPGFDNGDATGAKASFVTGTWYHYAMTNAVEDVKYGNRNSHHHGAIRCIRASFQDVEVVTPYPTQIELKQIDSASKEQTRMRHSLRKADLQVTGFYIEKGKQIVVDVEALTPASDGATPRIVIGTPGQVSNTSKDIALAVGVNTIEPAQHEGGLVYFRYVTDAATEPQGKAKISFTETSQQIRAPHYIYGKTTDDEFSSMLGKYETPEAIFSSDYLVVIATRDRAITYSMKEDKNKWIEGLHTLLQQEDIISGLDDNDTNPLHRRLKKGEVRHFMIETTSTSPHATNGYTAYPSGSVARYLTYDGTYGAPWMMAHEVGHQHQQGAYKINKATESTVNIYSYVVTRHIEALKGVEYNRSSAQRWQQAQTTYLSLPLEQRIYDMGDTEMEAIVGFNRDELRFMPWEQLFLLFGDDFYKLLHRITREEKIGGGTEQEIRAYLIWKSSQITGYDLRGFFDQWGIRVTEKYNKDLMDKTFEDALAQGQVATAPYTDTELVAITGQNKPAWAPLTMKGIKTSQPPAPDLQPADQLASKNKYTDYSTSTGVFQDTRDQQAYTYKKYGAYDWFTQNLNWADDRLDPTGNRPASIVAPSDPDGKVYGRSYITYAASSVYNQWCPEGWTYTTNADWNRLFADIQTEYEILPADLPSALKSGGDRDNVSDGLWAKGAGTLNKELSDKVGFNILPAGVYSNDAQDYEAGDEIGFKASFYEANSAWFHQVLTAKQEIIEHPNRSSRHYGSIRCKRPAATMIDQIVTFNPIEAKKVSHKVFDPGAIATSKLPITYTSSDESVATIVDGKVHIIGSGTATITAQQKGNDTFNQSPTVSRLLTVLGSDVTTHQLKIGGEIWDMTKPYVVDCANVDKEINVEIATAENATVDKGNAFKVDISKPSIQEVTFNILAEDGVENQEYTFTIKKRFLYEEIVATKWGNTFLINNNPTTNGNYVFKAYKWHKNGTAVGFKQYYSDNDANAQYHVQIETTQGDVLQTCPFSLPTEKSIAPNVYPNPISAGQTLYVDIAEMGDEFLQQGNIQVYNMMGILVANVTIKEALTSFTLSNSGIHIVKLNGKSFTKEYRILVK